jgi:putative transposase
LGSEGQRGAIRKIVTDQLRIYPAAKAEIPGLAQVKRVFVESSRAPEQPSREQRHPTRERESSKAALSF